MVRGKFSSLFKRHHIKYKDYLYQDVLLRVLTWDAILNSWSARAIATGGRLSRTALFVDMAPNGIGSFCAAIGCSNRKGMHK